MSTSRTKYDDDFEEEPKRPNKYKKAISLDDSDDEEERPNKKAIPLDDSDEEEEEEEEERPNKQLPSKDNSKTRKEIANNIEEIKQRIQKIKDEEEELHKVKVKENKERMQKIKDEEFEEAKIKQRMQKIKTEEKELRKIIEHPTIKTQVGEVEKATPEEERQDQGKIFFKKYREVSVLGKGSFGTAYKVKKVKDDGKYYVVKEIMKRTNLTDRELQDYNAMIENEVRMLEILKQDCTEYFACFFESKSTETHLYIVMEFLEDYKPMTTIMTMATDLLKDYSGLMLSQLVARDKNGDTLLLDTLFSNLFKGLKKMHSLGIAHNDIKPENIMVDEYYNIKFIDFGASCEGESCKKLNAYTIIYCDPEILLHNGDEIKSFPLTFFVGKGKYLKRAQRGDLWSLGCIIYQFVSGFLPIAYYNTQFESRYANKYAMYIATYKYSIDPLKDYIDWKLKFGSCNIKMDQLLTSGERKYFV